ncbi:MAG: HTH domain-containing protein [Nitrospirae bacterium]|nr:HTH domain-containing protein [Nitrospirota bacterium]
MSYKFDSLITILNKIDGKEKVTSKTLMNDLEVSERTAYRYIQTLQVAGFPLVYDRQKDSYVFSEGYSLSKPNLSLEESLALALSKKMLGSLGGGFEKGLSAIFLFIFVSVYKTKNLGSLLMSK